MNSFPTPESSPVIQFDAINSNNAGNEKKNSTKKDEKKKLSKSLSPGKSTSTNISVNGRRKSLFPKVVLPLFPKISNKVSRTFFRQKNYYYYYHVNSFLYIFSVLYFFEVIKREKFVAIYMRVNN